MAHRSLNPPRQRHPLMLGLTVVLPLAMAVASLVVAAQWVFPERPSEGGLLMVLGGASFAAAMFARQFGPREVLLERQAQGPDVIDVDSGLPGALLLPQLLQREIARCARYGDRSYLAIIEVKVFGFEPLQPGEEPPSHGKHVASQILGGVRATDTALRLDPDHFALLLTECDDDGAQLLFARFRTRVGTRPFATNADGSGVYARAWCAGVEWKPEYRTPQQFLAAAARKLEETRPEYDSALRWFEGTQAGEQAQGRPA